ncbi:basic amino acid ABC transporter substrate-binding protein [Collimonas sp. NPDC087041]|uniref:basic amino acid ABC transporter substrate-binding protein n=1 Tax=Collimonas sp. NPDC087041 TaxID=3363960 RepID=UPI00380865B7
MTSRYLPALMLACSLLALTACGKKEDGATAANAGRTEYVVGADGAYAPFASENEQKELVGFDIDTMKAVADKAGIKIKIVNTPFDGLFNALAQGDRDILISTITINDQRKQSMDFSEPYFVAKQLIVLPANSKVTKFEDLKSQKIGVQSGTTGDDAAQVLNGKNSASVKRFESMPLAFQELEGGGVDAVVGDNGVVTNFVKNNPGKNFRIVDDPSFPKEYYGIAVKKGNTELLAKLNHALEQIKADGTQDRIYKKYFADSQQ